MGEKKELEGSKLVTGTIDAVKTVIDRCEETNTQITLGYNESIRLILVPKDGSFKKNLIINLKGEGSRAEVLGILIGSGKNEAQLSINTIHTGRSTSAYTHVRGVLFDASKIFFTGLIKIEKEAIKTSSLLENRMLVLGDTAHAESIPSLEIEANDVKASHAATVGKIDYLQMFYLQSRGIEAHTAVRMITEGFFEKIFEKIPAEELVAEIRGSIWKDILRH